MSPFFESPEFIAAMHDERLRRLRQYSWPRRIRKRDDGRRRRS